jgi:hypothetical protein
VVVSEGAATGTEVLSLSATDPDSPAVGKVQYLISSGDETGMFQVDRWTGALMLQRPLDSERQVPRHFLACPVPQMAPYFPYSAQLFKEPYGPWSKEVYYIGHSLIQK